MKELFHRANCNVVDIYDFSRVVSSRHSDLEVACG